MFNSYFLLPFIVAGQRTCACIGLKDFCLADRAMYLSLKYLVHPFLLPNPQLQGHKQTNIDCQEVVERNTDTLTHIHV